MSALPPIIHWLGIALFVVTGLCALIDLRRQLRRPIRPYSKGIEQP